MRVVVTHPTHQHAYETAAAAQRSRMLERFVTGIYRRDTRRWHPGIDPARVTSLPAHDVASALAARTIGARVDHIGWMLRGFDAAAARRISRWPSDAVHAFEGAALATLGAARREGRLAVLDVPSAHERFAEAAALEGDSATRFPTERIRAERAQADLMLAPSEFVKSCLVEHGAPEERVAIVPYGADPVAYEPARPGGEGFHVAFVGEIGRRKGVAHLLDAWRRLRLPGARLTLAGRVADPSLVRDLPAGARWSGVLTRERVRQLMSGSHAFAFPSLAEGSALVTYEAMAAGLPSVVTPESGSPVRDGADGFVVPRRDATALAECLEALAEDPGLRERMGASARERIEQGYTWDHYRRRLVAAWEGARA